MLAEISASPTPLNTIRPLRPAAAHVLFHRTRGGANASLSRYAPSRCAMRPTAAIIAAVTTLGPALGADITGSYRGRGDGTDLRATVKATPGQAAVYRISLTSSSPGLNPPASRCSGSVTVTGVLRGYHLTGRATDGTFTCTLGLQVRGRTMKVEEAGLACPFHGQRCPFTGRLKRVRATAATAR